MPDIKSPHWNIQIRFNIPVVGTQASGGNPYVEYPVDILKSPSSVDSNANIS
jgi:hypothetical protein